MSVRCCDFGDYADDVALFEQCVLLVLDLIILKLMNKRGKNSDEMFLNHTNLE